ncbi:metallophosphoesterase 1 isoform X2 [Ambystoma mexicanum]|uniref:metallophosphoesterase 1 isoform X2 n=1 Tax=Ambystoma mexicanum TaxID=8296 RepID=UPI0037E9C498
MACPGSYSVQKILRFKKWGRFLLPLVLYLFLVLILCEFLIYYIVVLPCKWPEVTPTAGGRHEQAHPSVLKAMFLSDTHLLGNIRGHWWDKLRREWQMEQAFQSALWLFQPNVVFILGDVFDEGKWSSSMAWAKDVSRFQNMFRHPQHTELIAVTGNHDIGFHYDFVLVNSMTLEGDDCSMCKSAEAKLSELSLILNCSRKINPRDANTECNNVERVPASAPILLQHYPLYRRSDSECTGEDSATQEEKNVQFKEKYDVVSQEASQKLIWWFQPRLILSGHTHSACEVLHNGTIPEISVPSFSWRNRNNPSFIMAAITPTNASLSKCFLPRENTVIDIYCIASFLLGFLMLARLKLLSLPFYFVRIFASKLKPT